MSMKVRAAMWLSALSNVYDKGMLDHIIYFPALPFSRCRSPSG